MKNPDVRTETFRKKDNSLTGWQKATVVTASAELAIPAVAAIPGRDSGGALISNVLSVPIFYLYGVLLCILKNLM